MADISLGCLRSHLREKPEGFVYYSINGLQLRAMSQERKFKEAEESFKAHQSNARVDCQSNTSNDEKEENNLDMDNNSVMLRAESNKYYSEFIVSQETSPGVQNHNKSNKTTIFDFSKAEGVIHFNSDYFVIDQHVLVEESLSSEENCIVKEHNNGGKKGILACQHKVISSSSGKTGPTGFINRSDRSMKNVIVGYHQEEKHGIIHIKLPHNFNIFSKVRFAITQFQIRSYSFSRYIYL